MDPRRLRELIAWLTDGARSARTPMALLEQTCGRLVAAGLPLWRAAAFVRTLHPDVYGRSFVWRPGADVVVNTADFDLPESAQFTRSPLTILYASGREVRYEPPRKGRAPKAIARTHRGSTDSAL